MTDQPKCPICGTDLIQTSLKYNVQELFDQWTTIHQFSPEVISEHLEISHETTLYRCPKCLIEIFLPQIIGSNRFYQELQDDPAANYYQSEKWDFYEALHEVRKCHEILELGCGPGVFLSMADEFVERAVGTEYNPAALDASREKGLEVYGLETDMDPFLDHFDAVFSFHVLEHVADPIEFVKKMVKYTKPGGKICISVPNQAGPVKYLKNAVMNMPPHHATRWQLKTFQTMSAFLGLRFIRASYEPLPLPNSYYYSYYWVEDKFTANTKINRAFKHYLPPIINNIAKFFGTCKIKTFPLLKGQAIYVVMEKPIQKI